MKRTCGANIKRPGFPDGTGVMEKEEKTRLMVVKHDRTLNVMAARGMFGDRVDVGVDLSRREETGVWAALIFMLGISAVSAYFFAAGLYKAKRMENSLKAIRASRTNDDGGQVSKIGPSDYSFTALGRGMEKGRSSFFWPVVGPASAGGKEASRRGTADVPSPRRERGFIKAGIEPPDAASAARAAPSPSSSDQGVVSAAAFGRHYAASPVLVADVLGARLTGPPGKETWYGH